jgi:hypothetical protein
MEAEAGIESTRVLHWLRCIKDNSAKGVMLKLRRAGHRRLTEDGPESGGRIAAWVARTRFQILHLLQWLDFTSLEILMSLKFALAL